MKAMATGKVQGEIFNMLAEKGVPILQVMAKMYGVTTKQVMDMGSKGKITGKDLEKAFAIMSGKGGFAYQAMIKQSETFNGLMSTLKDNIGLTSAEIGLALLPYLKIFAVKMIAITDRMRAFTRENPKLVILITIFAGLAAAIGPLLIYFGMIASGISSIIAVASALAPVFAVIGTVIGAVVAVIGSVGIAIGLAVAAIVILGVILYKNFKPFKDLLDGIWNVIKAIIGGVISLGTGVMKMIFGGANNGASVAGAKAEKQNKQSVEGSFNANIQIGADQGLSVRKATANSSNMGLNLAVAH
jgi:tape measure domain-containing protein